jgi:hypothetical protein
MRQSIMAVRLSVVCHLQQIVADAVLVAVGDHASNNCTLNLGQSSPFAPPSPSAPGAGGAPPVAPTSTGAAAARVSVPGAAFPGADAGVATVSVAFPGTAAAGVSAPTAPVSFPGGDPAGGVSVPTAPVSSPGPAIASGLPTVPSAVAPAGGVPETAATRAGAARARRGAGRVELSQAPILAPDLISVPPGPRRNRKRTLAK